MSQKTSPADAQDSLRSTQCEMADERLPTRGGIVSARNLSGREGTERQAASLIKRYPDSLCLTGWKLERVMGIEPTDDTFCIKSLGELRQASAVRVRTSALRRAVYGYEGQLGVMLSGRPGRRP